MPSESANPRVIGLCAFLLVSITLLRTIPCSGGEIVDLYRTWGRPREMDTTKQLERFESLEKPSHGVTEIGMERTACHGTCPVYTVIIKADGTFRYLGEENVKMKGKHSGRIPPYQFNRLAEYVVESGYMNLEPNYDLPMIADFPSTYTTAVVDKKRKLVRNYGDLGPAKLWVLQQSIDSLLGEADWDGERKN